MLPPGLAETQLGGWTGQRPLGPAAVPRTWCDLPPGWEVAGAQAVSVNSGLWKVMSQAVAWQGMIPEVHYRKDKSQKVSKDVEHN